MTSRISTSIAALTVSACVLAACGGSSSTSESSAASASDAPAAVESGIDDFATLAANRLDELATTFGAPATPESLAALFKLPDDLPYPDGDVLGVYHSFERVDGTPRFNEFRNVGLDEAGTTATLNEFKDEFDALDLAAWEAQSDGRDERRSDTYLTPSDLDDVNFDQFVMITNAEAQPGTPYLTLRMVQNTTEIPVPSWQAGLPIPDGGELVVVHEGRGIVQAPSLFPAEDGRLELVYSYTPDRFDELMSLFTDGGFEAAGFIIDVGPSVRDDIALADITNGEWTGQVILSDLPESEGRDAHARLSLVLTRPGLVEAPVQQG